MTRTYISGGINWNHYLQGRFDDESKTVHILFYDRWHKYDQPRHPVYQEGPMEVMEDGKRVVYGIKVAGVEYLVTNPTDVYTGYRDFSELVLEVLS